MKCILLAGGQGTRLREETHIRPKPMLDIGDRPLLWHIMKTYAHYGHSDFIVCLGYLGQVIRDYFLNYEAMTNDVTVTLGRNYATEFHQRHAEQDFRVTLSDTGENTMTGGRIKRVAPYLQSEQTFMATYGDGLADVDIDALLAFHKSHGRIATITAARPDSRFGILDLDDNDKVTRFIEKPKLDGWINIGFFVFEREFLDYIEGDDTVLEKAPLERLASEGQLVAYKHPGFFYSMDTFREYQLLNEMWQQGKAPWKVWS